MARKPKPVRVLVVDDSTFMRKAIARILSGAPDMEVADTASSGEDALVRLRQGDIDVVTLDVVMPGLDGVATLRRVMRECPTPVVMLSAHTSENASVTFECLEAGAVDFVEKPTVYTNMNMPLIGEALLAKIRAAAGVDTEMLRKGGGAESAPIEPTDSQLTGSGERLMDALIIGSSTGGPPALSKILPRLPAHFPVPVAVVQHMPAGFTEPFAARLNEMCPLEVKEASDGDIFTAGRILVAKAGVHMRFERRGQHIVVRLDRRGPQTAHVPSIDITMQSAIPVFGSRILAILLTGMGADGAEGLLAIRRVGGHTIAEAESSAVIYGMPRAAVELGAARDVCDLAHVPSRMLTLCVK